ncbi:ABC transporter ATP-binding protein [Desulfococcaceae bacterium HSG7]|nr:ABC transporter ATP-binding protein [Desulfococcaceae bacterium HSG7]
MSTSAIRPDIPLLKVLNLRTHLPTERGIVHAADGVTFELCSGKTLAIVGESGCGKSVLCRALLGLLPKTAIIGEGSGIFYNGTNLVGLSEKAYNKIRAQEIAMIFQDPLSSLNPVMTIGKQIAETLIYHKKMKPGAARRLAIDLLQSAGVPGPKQRVDQYPHQLSGGMRQRAAIAIALACEPKLLIADEPTTALDVTVQEGILDLLGQLQGEHSIFLGIMQPYPVALNMLIF